MICFVKLKRLWRGFGRYQGGLSSANTPDIHEPTHFEFMLIPCLAPRVSILSFSQRIDPALRLAFPFALCLAFVWPSISITFLPLAWLFPCCKVSVESIHHLTMFLVWLETSRVESDRVLRTACSGHVWSILLVHHHRS